MKDKITIADKAYLTIEEASAYFGIGINKMREITRDRKCPLVVMNGRKRLINRKKMESYLNSVNKI